MRHPVQNAVQKALDDGMLDRLMWDIEHAAVKWGAKEGLSRYEPLVQRTGRSVTIQVMPSTLCVRIDVEQITSNYLAREGADEND